MTGSGQRNTTLALGFLGETRSIKYLKKAGYRFICRNYRCPFGEIDIIAKNGNDICFIEVKTRKSDSHGAPQEAVDRRKRDKLMRTALFYIKEKKLKDCSFRFDVVAVTDKINLIKDAFSMKRKYNV